MLRLLGCEANYVGKIILNKKEAMQKETNVGTLAVQIVAQLGAA